MTDSDPNETSTSSIYFEPHGISGTEGGLRAPILRDVETAGFDTAFWLTRPGRQIDIHAAFQSTLETVEDGVYELSVQCSGPFRLLVDGEVRVSGPLRYSPGLPEYHWEQLALLAGAHTIALHAHGEGITTRMAAEVPNFAWVELTMGGSEVELTWRGRELNEYIPTGLRVSPLLGWVEWQSTPWRRAWWTEDPHAWATTSRVDLKEVLGPSVKSELPLRAWPSVIPEKIGSGRFRDTYSGYKFDDLATQFLLADDDPRYDDDIDGFWWRYDLRRIRIGAMHLTVDSSEAAEVIIAYADRCTPDGRPSPVVALSAGPTRMLQHFSVNPGVTSIDPLQSLGGRYVEIRVRTSGHAVLSSERFVERESLGDPTGRFESDDPVLNAIWTTGIETLRSSAEDSLVDSVRERGEWVGDVVSSAIHILGSGWGDYRLVRRALLHAAAGARPDGMVAGCGPGEIIYLGTYAAQWVTACLDVAAAEGSLELLRELEGPASLNMDALVALVHDDGTHDLPWSFVDWGYAVPDAQVDLAVIATVYRAVCSWITWRGLLGHHNDSRWRREAEKYRAILEARLPSPGGGYHSLTLAAVSGVLSPAEVSPLLLEHIENGFPMNQSAPRLRDPTQASSTSVTPYFTNYSAAILLEAGHGERVADIWRAGWGWMLSRGATTWWEVFDERWSQCHYWSGAPTWQMSRFGLGLHPVLDLDGFCVRLRVNDLGLSRLSGAIHLPGGTFAEVDWVLDGDRIRYTLNLSAEAEIEQGGRRTLLPPGQHLFTLMRVGDSSLYE